MIYNVLISSIRQSDSVVYVFFFMFFSITFCHRILNIVPCLLTFLVLLWSLPFDFPFFSLSIYICYTASCHNKGIDRGVTQTCVQIQALPFFPVLLLLSHVWLCDPVNCSQPGPFVCGIPQVRILEWVAVVTLGKLPTFPQLCYIPGVIMKSFSYLFSPLYCVYESRGDLSALKGSILIFLNIWEIKFIVVQSLSCVQLFRLHGLHPARLPCPPLSPGVCSDSCPLSWWQYLTISPAASFSESFLASGSFPLSGLLTSSGQIIETSALALVLPVNIQGWFPLGLTDLISLQSKGLSRVFSSTTVLVVPQFFGA